MIASVIEENPLTMAWPDGSSRDRHQGRLPDKRLKQILHILDDVSHLLCGGPLPGVLTQQLGHKVLGLGADAVPGLAFEIHLIAEYGLPAGGILCLESC